MKYYYISFITLLLFSCGKKTNETKAVRKDITETVFASGTLEPENKYNLTAQTEGYIAELKFDFGDTVKTGQVLALIDNRVNQINAESAVQLLGLAGINASAEGPTLKQAAQNLELLRVKNIQDSTQFARYERLYQSNSVSKLEMENAKLAAESSKTGYLNALQNYRLLKQQTEQALIVQRSQKEASSVSSDYNAVKAVVGGRIYRRLKEAGDYVRRGDVIAVIGDAGEMYAKLGVDESSISKIKTGQKVIIQLNTEKEKNHEGYVVEIYPYFDEPTQSFYCKVRFSQAPSFRAAGTQLQANIVIGRNQNALVIPRTFLGYGNIVHIKGKGDANVKTGFISGEWVEITGGLDENTTIVSDL